MEDDGMPIWAAGLMICGMAFLLAFSVSIFFREPERIVIEGPEAFQMDPDGTIRRYPPVGLPLEREPLRLLPN